MGEGVVSSGDGGEEGIGLGKSLGYSVRKGVGGSDGECVGVSVVGGSDGIEVVGSAVGDVLGEGVGLGVAATRAALFMRLLKLKMLLRSLFMRSGFILDGLCTYAYGYGMGLVQPMEVDSAHLLALLLGKCWVIESEAAMVQVLEMWKVQWWAKARAGG